jgi:hypothetical protein
MWNVAMTFFFGFFWYVFGLTGRRHLRRPLCLCAWTQQAVSFHPLWSLCLMFLLRACVSQVCQTDSVCVLFMETLWTTRTTPRAVCEFFACSFLRVCNTYLRYALTFLLGMCRYPMRLWTVTAGKLSVDIHLACACICVYVYADLSLAWLSTGAFLSSCVCCFLFFLSGGC